MTTAEILANLAADDEPSSAFTQLEGHFQLLDEASDLDAVTRYRLDRARDALALAELAIERLTKCHQSAQ